MIIRILKKIKDLTCPDATQDVALNTEFVWLLIYPLAWKSACRAPFPTKAGVWVTAGCIILNVTPRGPATLGPLAAR